MEKQSVSIINESLSFFKANNPHCKFSIVENELHVAARF
jgi:hypothetical protein